MDQHVGVELGDGVDNGVVVVWRNPVERRTLQTTTRRICVDTGQRTHPRLIFEEIGHQGAEFTTHPTYEDSPPCHDS